MIVVAVATDTTAHAPVAQLVKTNKITKPRDMNRISLSYGGNNNQDKKRSLITSEEITTLMTRTRRL